MSLLKVKNKKGEELTMVTYFPILNISTAEMNAYASLKESTKSSIIPILQSKKIPRHNKDTWWTTFNTLGSYLSSKMAKHEFIYDYKQAYDKLGEFDEVLFNEINEDIITHCSKKMLEYELNFIPVVHFDSPQWFIDSILKLRREKIAIRVRCHDFNSTLDNIIFQTINSNIISRFEGSTKKYYVILDFGNKPSTIERIRKAVNIFSQINNSEIILSITSCPEDASNVGAMSFDVGSLRDDFKSFNLLKSEFPYLKFSDYTVRFSPEPDQDARIDYYNTYIKIFYTTEDTYMIGKSSLIKDNGIDNFHLICQEIVESDLYFRENFSEGDKALKLCAERSLIISNHSKTIEYGINHHIELTSTQLRQSLRVFNAS